MSYNPAVALEFFKAAGTPTDVARSTVIFAENEAESALLRRRSRIYLLLDGEVSLLAGLKVIATVRAGEIFGEMAAITHAPRSATAVAQTDCRVIALDDAELKTALERKPAFALMLMSVMLARLRETIARLRAASALSGDEAIKESAVFNTKLLADMVRGLSDDPPVSYMRHQAILKEGQLGTRMYAVLEGTVAVSIDGQVVDRVGPGGVLGELALLGQSPRLASAVADDNCALQPINRNAFLALVKLKPELGVALLTALAERLRFLTSRLK
jgi:CRP-like cAMP-binding protein